MLNHFESISIKTLVMYNVLAIFVMGALSSFIPAIGAIWWLGMGALNGYVIGTNKKNYSPIYAILGGLFFGPLFSWLMLLVTAKAPRPKTMKECPKCAETVKAKAIVCKHCGHQFEGSAAK